MKQYILIKDSLDVGMAMVVAASLASYLKFIDHADTQQWLKISFKKVICKVNAQEFEEAKNFDDYLLVTESRLDHIECVKSISTAHAAVAKSISILSALQITQLD